MSPTNNIRSNKPQDFQIATFLEVFSAYLNNDIPPPHSPVNVLNLLPRNFFEHLTPKLTTEQDASTTATLDHTGTKRTVTAHLDLNFRVEITHTSFHEDNEEARRGLGLLREDLLELAGEALGWRMREWTDGDGGEGVEDGWVGVEMQGLVEGGQVVDEAEIEEMEDAEWMVVDGSTPREGGMMGMGMCVMGLG